MKIESVEEILISSSDMRRADDIDRAYVLWDNLIDIALTREQSGQGRISISFYECGLSYSVDTARINDIAISSERFCIWGSDSCFALYRRDCEAIKKASLEGHLS